MDYEIKPTNRKDLRLYAKLFRSVCGVSQSEPIDPVALLDRLPDLEGFDGVRYEIVYNNALGGNVPARCLKDDDGYVIQIKEKVYLGAYERKIGGDRMHIIHEIMHVYLDKLGFKPIYSRQLREKLPLYRSLEWATMAIAGEVMMPYEFTVGMGTKELMSVYGLSKAAAEKRQKYELLT